MSEIGTQLNSNIALLLVQDLLLAKKGISAPTSHPLRLAVEKHKTRLNAEFTKARFKRGFASLEALQAHVDAGNLQARETSNKGDDQGGGSPHAKWLHPRWIRVNTLKTTLQEQMETTLANYKVVESFGEILLNCGKLKERLLYVDDHVPNLIALTPAPDIAKSSAYLNGLIILQDKASCFPAYLLDPDPRDGDVLDACAAPGNKTTQIVATLQEKAQDGRIPRIFACERDNGRAGTLSQLVSAAGALKFVTIKAGQDFLRLNPEQAPWNDIRALLLDPSCSGSGIVGRDEVLEFKLPSKRAAEQHKPAPRKRRRQSASQFSPVKNDIQEENPLIEDKSASRLSDRLSVLSEIQLKLLLHAFQFPRARKISYSTCSIYAEENEQVVLKALNSSVAKDHAWRLLPRDQQVSGMKAWGVRGSSDACIGVDALGNLGEVAEACIRCEKATKEGTQGFFVAAFIRHDARDAGEQVSDEEWEGLSEE